MDLQERKALLRSIASKDAQGAMNREAYVRSRAQKLMPIIKKESTARLLFKPEELDPGAVPEYPLAPKQMKSGWVSPGVGLPPARQYAGKTIIPPTFYVDGYGEFPVSVARQGRLDIAAEADTDIKNGIVAQEEYTAWAVAKAALEEAPDNVCSVSASGCTFDLVNELIYRFNRNKEDYPDLVLRVVFISDASARDIRAWASTDLAEVKKEEVFGLGQETDSFQIRGWNFIFRVIHDASLLQDEEGNDAIWGVDTERFGRMPITEPLETMQNPVAIAQWNVGIMARERIGFCVTNPFALVKGPITNH
mgnify:CR=1 FL=1